MSFCPRLSVSSVSSVLRIPCRKWCWWRSLQGSLHRTTTSGAQDTNESVIPIDFIIEIAMKLHRRLSQHLPHIVLKQCFYHSFPILLLVQRYENIPFERDIFVSFSLSKGILFHLFLLVSTSSNYHHHEIMRFYPISVFISSLLVNFLVTLYESHLNGWRYQL